jgi:hypothetical protein
VLLVVTFNNLVHCKVTGEWRKLYNEELHDLYSSLTHYCVGDKIERDLCSSCNAVARIEADDRLWSAGLLSSRRSIIIVRRVQKYAVQMFARGLDVKSWSI